MDSDDTDSLLDALDTVFQAPRKSLYQACNKRSAEARALKDLLESFYPRSGTSGPEAEGKRKITRHASEKDADTDVEDEPPEHQQRERRECLDQESESQQPEHQELEDGASADEGLTDKESDGERQGDTGEEQARAILPLFAQSIQQIHALLKTNPSEALGDAPWTRDPRIVDLHDNEGPTIKLRRGLSQISLGREYESFELRNYGASTVERILKDVTYANGRKGHISQFISERQFGAREASAVRKGIQNGIKLLVLQALAKELPRIVLFAVYRFSKFRDLKYTALVHMVNILSCEKQCMQAAGAGPGRSIIGKLISFAAQDSTWLSQAVGLYEGQCQSVRQLITARSHCVPNTDSTHKRRRLTGPNMSDIIGRDDAEQNRIEDSAVRRTATKRAGHDSLHHSSIRPHGAKDASSELQSVLEQQAASTSAGRSERYVQSTATYQGLAESEYLSESTTLRSTGASPVLQSCLLPNIDATALVTTAPGSRNLGYEKDPGSQIYGSDVVNASVDAHISSIARDAYDITGEPTYVFSPSDVTIDSTYLFNPSDVTGDPTYFFNPNDITIEPTFFSSCYITGE